MSNTVSAADIPTDVMIEILARVPVKSLLRFKSVRKSWYSLIHRPNFIAKQLRYASTIEENYCAIVTHRISDSHRLAISFLPDKTDSSLTDLLDNPVPIPFFDELQGKLGGIRVRFCGPCNGIICAYGHHNPYNKHRQGGVTYTVDANVDNEHMLGDLISLWNPATREMKRLPFSNIPRCGEDRCTNFTIGFGFDSGAKDYKVVKILNFKDEGEALEIENPVVEVYNSSSNVWRKIDAVMPTFGLDWSSWPRPRWLPSVSLDGFSYWYCFDFTTILSFDFVNEVFDAFPIPSLIEDEYGDAILKYKESLAIVVHGSMVGVNSSLYVLEKDGNTKTWSKLLEIADPEFDFFGILRNDVALIRFHPNSYSDTDDNVTLCNKLIWYDLKSYKVLNERRYGDDDYEYGCGELGLVNYVESLVTFEPTNGGSY